MSRKRMLVLVLLVIAIVIVFSTGLGGVLERWLLRLHGAHADPAPAVTTAETVRKRAVKDGWPDTPAGLLAYEWVEALASGDDAMKRFFETHVAREALAKRPMPERLASTRAMRERLGLLTLASIEKSEPAELTASLLAEDATRHQFIFKVQPDPPHYLVSISTFDTRHVGHGGHGGH